jgi:hypothetical protein
LQAEEVADALHGGVAIGFRIFREEFMRDQRAVGLPSDNVGESTAAIDPEIPGLLKSLVMMCGTQADSAPFSRIIAIDLSGTTGMFRNKGVCSIL